MFAVGVVFVYCVEGGYFEFCCFLIVCLLLAFVNIVAVSGFS